MANTTIVYLNQSATRPAISDTTGVTLSALVGAMLVGVGGARWLSSEVDKRLLRVAGSQAADPARPDAQRAMLTASPADAVRQTAQ